ncbi:MAG: DUF4974 domain-containing protein [Muribaculaceae bacterium]|nr:DUF4974 domain-containing protein [Muribaculaceae bacterium]
MNNEEIDFIARRYRKGRFSPDAGWHRLGIAPVSIWRRYRVAAAVAATVILSATATILYREYRSDNVTQQSVPVRAVAPLAEVKVIDFENAPLSEVVKKIETVYNVKVEGVPASTDGYELSLHYEGTPTDLIAVINDILGTEMTVTEK